MTLPTAVAAYVEEYVARHGAPPRAFDPNATTRLVVREPYAGIGR